MNTVEAIKHLMLDAGAGWVLWMLAALSVASLAITLERSVALSRAGGDLGALARGLAARLEAGDEAGALVWLSESDALAARVAAAGLALSARGTEAVERAIASRTALERESLERRLAFLGTLGNNAPFIGLFGTVIGVIQAFEELGHGAAGHGGASGAAAGSVASGAVMSAIAEALVATAVGIAVALPAIAAYNYLQRKSHAILAGSEVLSNLALAYLAQTRAPRRAPES